jgi:hypothetical protein
MNVHSFIQFIKYRSKAKTRHGIHSPFVYAFIDYCLGKKSQHSLEQRINTYFGDALQWDAMTIDAKKKLVVVAVKDIHTTEANTAQWNKLCSQQEFQITIDLFSIGLLVHNAEVKEKQHFVLKYPL